MKRFFQSEIGAAVIWVICALTMAAVISPWVYQGGKWLAAEAAAKDLPAFLEWLGAACGRSLTKFGRYFSRSLLFSALVLLPLLIRRIRGVRAGSTDYPAGGLRRVPLKIVATQIVVGCVIAGGLLFGLGIVLYAVGASVLHENPPTIGKLLPRIIITALGASLVEECVFRGLILGLWLRFAKPTAACIGTSLVFAFLHFIEPPDGTVIADPSHPLAGIELLGKIMLHFSNPQFFVTDFSILFVIGLILAWVRVRTGALWFSIGLHAGWVGAYIAFKALYINVENHPLRPWCVGDSLREGGLLPMLVLGLTALVCHYALKAFPKVNPA